MAITNLNILAAMPIIWPQPTLAMMLAEESPLLNLMPKHDGFTQRSEQIIFETAPIGGRSATFSDAQDGVASSMYYEANSQRVTDYAVFRITTEEKRAAIAKGGKAPLDLVKRESKNAMVKFMQDSAVALFGNGSGSIGVIASGQDTDTITLENIADIIHFEENQRLTWDTVDGTGTVESHTKTVGRVDYDAGTITTSDATTWDSTGGFAAGGYLFPVGDYGLRATGLEGWLPVTVSTSDSFTSTNLNRSVNRVRLAGVPYVASPSGDGTISRAISSHISKMGRIGRRTKPDYYVVDSIRYDQLLKEQGSARVIVQIPGKNLDNTDATFGFEALRIATQLGTIPVLEDRYCNVNRGYAIKLDTWKLRHLGGFPSWIVDSPKGNFTMPSADAEEYRIGAYYNIQNWAPVYNGVCDFSQIAYPGQPD